MCIILKALDGFLMIQKQMTLKVYLYIGLMFESFIGIRGISATGPRNLSHGLLADNSVDCRYEFS